MAKKKPGDELPADENKKPDEAVDKQEKPELSESQETDQSENSGSAEQKKSDTDSGDPNNPETPAPAVDETLPDQKPLKSKSINIVEQVYTGTAERTVTESAYHADSLKRPFNPDPLVMRDWSYRIYEEMMEDDQVSIAMQLKKDLAIGDGWLIETKDPTQIDIKKDLERALGEDPDRPFTEILEDILQAYQYGFSVSEKIFKLRDDGTLALKDIKPRHPATWLLHTDKHGNVSEYEQRGNNYDAVDRNTGGSRSGSINVDPQSIIHYVNNPMHQNPYGRSDLRTAYQAWMTKRHITRFYAIYLEKAASPIPVAKYDSRAPQDAINNVFEAIKKFQTRTALTIPKDFEIEFLEAKNNGEAYVKGINLFNMFIGRALFIPDLMGFSGSETGGGSFALGKDQINLAFRHLARRRAIIERIINQHIIKPICIYNHGMMDDYPTFRLKPMSDEDAIKNAELWIKAMQGKMWTPTAEEINHFREIVKFPTSDIIMMPGQTTFDPETGKPVQGPPTYIGAEGMPVGPDGKPLPAEGEEPGEESMGPDGKPLPKEGEQLPKEGKGGLDSADGTKGGKGEQKGIDGEVGPGVGGKGPQGADAPEGKETPPGQAKEKTPDGQSEKPADEKVKKKVFTSLGPDSHPGHFHKRVDFAAAEQALVRTTANILDQAKELQNKMFEDLYDQIQKKKILVNKDMSRADSLTLKNKKQLQLLFKQYFRELYNTGKKAAKAELLEQTAEGPQEFAKKNIPNDEFLDFLDQETFNYIGDWEYTVLKQTRTELVKQIKDGGTLTSLIDVLDDEGKRLSEVSLERYARTKSTEVFNKGRIEYFESTGIVEAYQYSAILDDRTSEICEELHGKIFAYDDAPIPPLHFNCRSLLIPITRFDDYKVDDKTSDGESLDEFVDDNLGKGFGRF